MAKEFDLPLTMKAQDVYFLSLLLSAFAQKSATGKPFTETDAANCREAADTLKKIVRQQLTESQFIGLAGEVGKHIVDLQEIGGALDLLRGES